MASHQKTSSPFFYVFPKKQVFEAWCLTFKKGNKLKVSENRVLRKKLGPKGGEVIGSGVDSLIS